MTATGRWSLAVPGTATASAATRSGETRTVVDLLARHRVPPQRVGGRREDVRHPQPGGEQAQRVVATVEQPAPVHLAEHHHVGPADHPVQGGEVEAAVEAETHPDVVRHHPHPLRRPGPVAGHQPWPVQPGGGEGDDGGQPPPGRHGGSSRRTVRPWWPVPVGRGRAAHRDHPGQGGHHGRYPLVGVAEVVGGVVDERGDGEDEHPAHRRVRRSGAASAGRLRLRRWPGRGSRPTPPRRPGWRR